MESQDIKNAISGILVVDKPVGMTSHDVVAWVRRRLGAWRWLRWLALGPPLPPT